MNADYIYRSNVLQYGISEARGLMQLESVRTRGVESNDALYFSDGTLSIN